MKFISTTIYEYLTERNNSLNDNFWKWFSDSKIIENGKPLICYHGTSISNIDSFDISRVGHNTGNYGHYGFGIYFSEDIREAKIYGDVIYKCYIKMLNPFTGTNDQIMELKNNGISGIDDLDIISIDFNSFKNSFKSDPIIFKFINDIEKYGSSKAWEGMVGISDDLSDKLNDIYDIIEYTTFNKNVHGVPEYILDDLSNFNISPKLNKGFMYNQSLHWITDLGNQSKEVTEKIKELGYDGVWYGSEIVVFDPSNIKSIDNNGEWDNSDNIYN